MSAQQPPPGRSDLVPADTPGLVVHGAGDLRIEEVPVRSPGPAEVVLDVRYGGICGSDLHYWRHGAAGQSIIREPLVLGHEVVGVVAQPAADGSGPPAGTPVAVHPARPDPGDGTIRYPPERPNLSPGCTYLGSAAQFPHTQGAFARYVTLAADMLRPLPAGLELRTAALTEPASVAWHAVERAGGVASLAGRTVLVVGAGPIGALTAAVLIRAGAEVVVSDLHSAPLDRARRLGVARTVAATDTDALRAVQADVTIESSGSLPGLETALQSTARGGRVVLLGLIPNGPQPIALATAITRELDLYGSFRFNDEIDPVLSALADGSLAVEPVITHEFALTDAHQAMEVAGDPGRSGKVLLTFGG